MNLSTSLSPQTQSLLSRALTDPTPEYLDPAVIWEAWSSLIRALVEIGYSKTSISRYAELTGSCSTGVSRFVMYPADKDWGPTLPPGRHHNSGQSAPWTSPTTAGLLYRAIRNLSRLPARHHHGIASRALAALNMIHRELQFEDMI